ncbi:MAG: family 78 glycoside hydrolase catalytic domain [Clostridiales bacterium]|nr:family 78 glycoside hydrolase catalytic domain [Clostridiales bacterium]
MTKAKWIWAHNGDNADEYISFKDEFIYTGGKTELKISCDSNYECRINGKLAAFGQYADLPHYKIYDLVDITEFCREGNNTIEILVWYIGFGSFTYYKNRPGLIYEISGSANACSGEHTLCAEAAGYMSGRRKLITTQMGFGYGYDAGKPAGRYVTALEVKSLSDDMKIRPIKKLTLGKFSEAVLIDREKRIYDLGRETVGYLSFTFKAKKGEKVLISFGEHLDKNGNVPRIIGERDFSLEFVSDGNVCEFSNFMRRLGCRFLSIECSGDVEVLEIGLYPAVYPLTEKPFETKSELYRRIYETCVRTLRLCMFEHYEDCPWREQSFYMLDSRNQMISGYYAFEETEFQRAAIKLMEQDYRDDKLLHICVPSGDDFVIPFFSLFFPVALEEYLAFTGDEAFAMECMGKTEDILSVFVSRIERGIVPNFYNDARYWNFYEWNDTLAGVGRQPQEKLFEMMLSSAVSYSLSKAAIICRRLGMPDKAEEYESTYESLNIRIHEVFFDGRLYRTFEGKDLYAVLPNAFGVLCGASKGEEAVYICDRIAAGEIPIPCTLSMKAFIYDAMLMTDEERYREYILSDIAANYSHMLDNGATSFWETIEGAEAFGKAGSLCHGWSAIPVVYLNKLAK